jgi:hypothetical protein
VSYIFNRPATSSNIPVVYIHTSLKKRESWYINTQLPLLPFLFLTVASDSFLLDPWIPIRFCRINQSLNVNSYNDCLLIDYARILSWSKPLMTGVHVMYLPNLWATWIR